MLYSLFLSATKNKHKQTNKQKQNSESLNHFSFPNLLGTSFCLLTFLGRMVGFFLLPHYSLGTSSCGLIVSGSEKGETLGSNEASPSPSLPSRSNHQGRQEQCNLKLVPSSILYNGLLPNICILSSVVICGLFVPLPTSLPFPTITPLDQPPGGHQTGAAFTLFLISPTALSLPSFLPYGCVHQCPSPLSSP